MEFPTIVALIPQGFHCHPEEDFSKLKVNSHLATDDEVLVSMSICSDRPQILLLGATISSVWDEQALVAQAMRDKNPKLFVVLFGLDHFPGPPRKPFDMFIAKTHEDKNHVESLRIMASEFQVHSKKWT